MGMADKMKEKALPGTSVVRSSKVVKIIDKADAFELNKANEYKIEEKILLVQKHLKDINLWTVLMLRNL